MAELSSAEQCAPRSTNLASAVASLASIVLGHLCLDDVLQRVTEIAKLTVAGASEVSVTMHERSPQTAASTAPSAVAVDQGQYLAGDGPCLDALRLRETVIVDDLAVEARWPDYSSLALGLGVRSSVSVPLEVDKEPVAALNIYADQPHAFAPAAIADAEGLARYASVVLNNAALYFNATARADQMAEAMKSRAAIEQAKGILMGGRCCSADEAFDLLVSISQRSGRKLHVVAQALIDQIPMTSEDRRDATGTG